MIIDDNHSEEFFFEYTCQSQAVILGYPWLRSHNPFIYWATEEKQIQ